MLKFSREEGLLLLDESKCLSAAWGSQLETLKWLWANGCPWDQETCENAAQHRELEFLKWARANGCPWNKENCAREAEENGYAKVAKWIRESD